MEEKKRIQILENAKNFFRNEIVGNHVNKACNDAKSLSNYNINPFLVKYLAYFLRGNGTPRSIAEALIYPRILGSSITTSFGMKVQKLISTLFEGFGSTTPGIDIEFIDEIDGRHKYCQLKSGPNTINFDDVETIFGHFQATINLARTNNLPVGLNDLIVGVIYGDTQELSSHYQKINTRFPVYTGQDFWHRLTGKDTFYLDLIDSIGEVALEVDGTNVIEETIRELSYEIEEKFFK